MTKRTKLNLLYKLSYLNSNFALTLGYLNPALNNPAQARTVMLRPLTNYMFVVLFYLVKVLVFLCFDLLGVF